MSPRDLKIDMISKEPFEKKEKHTYSLNPGINKRIKSKRIVDLRK